MHNTIRVAIVEDTSSLRESLITLLRASTGFECMAAYASAEDALARLPALRPDVVLMDLHLPKMNGAECVRLLREKMPGTQFIMLTVEEDSREIFQALEAGATGYLVKRASLAKLLEAIEEVHAGGSPMSPMVARLVVQQWHRKRSSSIAQAELTSRELEILQHLSQGFTYKEIGAQLRIEIPTVKTHLRHIFEKLHVRSRTEAVVKFLDH